ncbi:MAG: hydrogenase subunit MbhD domain-containing protein [Clostridiaceae bacterium]
MLWQLLNAPDVAITEAAVGAGITTLLFVLTLKRIKGVKK